MRLSLEPLHWAEFCRPQWLNSAHINLVDIQLDGHSAGYHCSSSIAMQNLAVDGIAEVLY